VAGEAIQQVLLFPLSPILFNLEKDYSESEGNCPETKTQRLGDGINSFLSIREEPYSSFDLMSVNELRISDFGLTQGRRFNRPDY